MKEHELKLWATYWDDVKEGHKTFEIRRNDRNFRDGDTIRFREYLMGSRSYTGREMHRKITYVLENVPGLRKGYCILGFKAVRNA